MARLVGVVLAGGRSTRFGSEKAVAEVDGAPMVARVAGVLALGCEAVAVNAPAASAAAAWARRHGLPVLPDPAGSPDGPLAGVLAGLDWAAAQGADGLLTSPCDTPHLPSDLALRLAERLARGAPAVLAGTRFGTHPLCAGWSTALREPLRGALAGGRHPSVREWLETQGAERAWFRDPFAFENLNTPPRTGLSGRARVADGLALALLLVMALGGVLALMALVYAGDPTASPLQALRVGRLPGLGGAACLGLTTAAVAAVGWLARDRRDKGRRR